MTKHIHGGDVYKYNHCLDFSANCNPLGTPQSVKQAIIDCVDDLGDYPRVGCGPLREAIASYEHTRKEYLICGNGAADLIFSLCRAQNPKKALLLAPTFAEYEQALVSVGCEISRYYLKEENDFCILAGNHLTWNRGKDVLSVRETIICLLYTSDAADE